MAAMAKSGLMLGRLRWALRQRGVVGTLRMVAARVGRRGAPLRVHPFDVEHGVETSGLIGGGTLAADHPHAVFSTAYFGVPPSRMRGVLERWRSTEGVGRLEERAFVDLGCGKGRALMLAAEMPFREAMGVELDRGLAAVAQRNVRRWVELGRARCPVGVVQGDATEVELPAGPLVVYLYNPFRAEVLRRLLLRLEERGGLVDVIYLYPEDEAVFREFPQFQLLWSAEIGLGAEDVGADEISEWTDPCQAYRLM